MTHVEPDTGAGRRFERHAFVCVNESSCAIGNFCELRLPGNERLPDDVVESMHCIFAGLF